MYCKDSERAEIASLLYSALTVSLSLALSACGGGGGGGSSAPGYTISGSVSGLASGQTLTLQDNNLDVLTVDANGPFTFAKSVTAGGSYRVTVTSQPTGQNCSVSNGVGSSIAADVSTVSVQCSLGYYTVGGTLSGLASGTQLTLSDNGSDVLTVATNGSFAFKTPVAYGAPYSVAIGSQPDQQFCTVSSGGGTVSAAVTSVQVACNTDEQVLYTFTGPGGASPQAGLIMDRAGNLYGTTTVGGAGGYGTVFELSPNGSGGYTESVLHSFAGGDGAVPSAALIMDGVGNLYGTTQNGGQVGEGEVFELSPTPGGDYLLSVLHTFTGSTAAVSDGGAPGAALIMDSAGNLYGTTQTGDIDNDGVVFELSPSVGGGYQETPLYSFNYTFSGINDGADCLSALYLDSAGNLYSTTNGGGDYGFGTFFKLSPGPGGYTETIFYQFTGLNDGGQSQAGLITDSAGNFYGTSSGGGAFGYGLVFEFSPKATGGYTETVLYTFTGGADGGGPVAELISDSAGNLYGTTIAGGPNNKGVVFQLSSVAGGYTESVLYAFSGGNDGGKPSSSLIMDNAGNLYGTALEGGTSNDGVVFEIRLH